MKKYYNQIFIIAFLDMDWSSFAQYVIDSIVCAFKMIVLWFMDTMISLITPLLDSALGGISDAPSVSGDVQNALAYANFFLPVQEVISLSLTLITFLAIYSAIKIAIKLIPTIG